MSMGDVLYVSRGPYMHAGVDMGDGTIVHFTGEGVSKAGARVQRTSKEEFLLGDEVVFVQRPTEPLRVLQRALSMLGRGSYDLFFNNCQHFAHWCLTGESGESEITQGLKLATLPMAAAAGFAVVMVLPAAIFGYGMVQMISRVAQAFDTR